MTIKRLRGKKVSQAALAKKVGTHPMYISQLERGVREPSLAMLRKIARALGVPVSQLLE